MSPSSWSDELSLDPKLNAPQLQGHLGKRYDHVVQGRQGHEARHDRPNASTRGCVEGDLGCVGSASVEGTWLVGCRRRMKFPCCSRVQRE